MKIISIANVKGGTGKTNIAIGLAKELSKNYKVLLIDNDPQSSITSILLNDIKEFEHTLYNVYLQKNIGFNDCIYEFQENFYIVPNCLDSMTLDLELSSKGNRENILLNKLKTIPNIFDFIIIDNSPFISLQMKNSIVISDLILCPIDNSSSSLQGYNMMLKTLISLQDDNLISKKNIFVLRNRFDKTSKFTKDFNKTVEEVLKNNLLDTIIFNSIKYKEASALHKTIQEHSKEHAKVFEKLTKEIIKKI